MSNDNAGRNELQPARWEAAVLVCKDCRRRKNGPQSVKTKAVVQELKAGLSHAERRTRVMRTGCLSVCPKNAVAVAVLGGGRPMTATVSSGGEAKSVARHVAAWIDEGGTR